MIERGLFIQDETVLALNMPLHRQPKNEASCMVYSLWMSAEALGVNLLDEKKVKTIYRELVDTSGSFSGIYPNDLIGYVQKYLPELSVRMRSIISREDKIIGLVVASILDNKALVSLDFEKEHSVPIKGIDVNGHLEVNDPIRGRRVVDIRSFASQSIYRNFLEVGRAA
jgi:hypothetical protein